MARHHGLSARLAAQAGVTPSPDWLEACRAHLSALDKENHSNRAGGAAGGSAAEEDDVLHHILHSDLRDVVRRLDNGGGFGSDGSDDSDGRLQPGRVLRQAIAASLRPGGGSNSNSNNDSRSISPRGPMHDAVVTPPPPPGSSGNGNGSHGNTCVATLPPDFCLLLQAEECTDVSRNAEGRLGGPQNQRRQQQQYQQQGRNGGGGKRLLKILGSDGYYPHGLATPPPPQQQQLHDEQQHSIVLMETAPIPALSADAPSGIKLLLHSSTPNHPITVRHGIVQIHPANCTVLGGHVPHLLDVQRRAREVAQRRAGVGVDATVRALIGPEGLMNGGIDGEDGNGEADDEGEGASGDVVAPPPSQVQQQVQQGQTQQGQRNQYQQQQQPQPQPPPPQPPQNQYRQQQPQGQNQYQRNRSNQSQQQQQQQQRQGSMEWTPSPPPPTASMGGAGAGSGIGSGNTNPYQQQSQGQQSNRSASTGRPTPSSSSSFSNPYASSGGGSGGSGAANPYANSSRTTTSNNPYSSVPVPAPVPATTTGTGTAQGTISSWMASSAAAGRGSKTPAATSRVPTGGGGGRGGASGDVVDLCSPEGSAGPSNGRPSSSTSTAAMPAAHAAAAGGASGMDIDDSNQGPIAALHGSQDSASTAPAAAAAGSGDASSFDKATPASTSTGTSSGMASLGASTPGVSLGLPPSSGAYTEPLSFSELRSLLLQIKSDRSAYEKYQDKVFIVPCKLNKTLFDFRFEKIRSSKKGKGSGSKGEKKKSPKEYEFCLTAHLNGTVRDGDAKISARFASRLIEPFYSVRPTDLRKMHKEDKERANKLASEGSTQVISEYSDLTPLHMKLLLSAKDYFAQAPLPDSIDGSTPLVLVTSVGR